MMHDKEISFESVSLCLTKRFVKGTKKLKGTYRGEIDANGLACGEGVLTISLSQRYEGTFL